MQITREHRGRKVFNFSNLCGLCGEVFEFPYNKIGTLCTNVGRRFTQIHKDCADKILLSF